MFSFKTKGQLLNSPSDMPILWRKEMKRILRFLNEELADKGISGGSRIFPGGGRQLSKRVREPIFLVKNCMKMKEFWPQGGRASLAPPLRSATGYSRKWCCIEKVCNRKILY